MIKIWQKESSAKWVCSITHGWTSYLDSYYGHSRGTKSYDFLSLSFLSLFDVWWRAKVNCGLSDREGKQQQQKLIAVPKEGLGQAGIRSIPSCGPSQLAFLAHYDPLWPINANRPFRSNSGPNSITGHSTFYLNQ